jgi:hypothetical protein
MRFVPVPRDPFNPGNLQSLATESGRYRLEVNRVMFGYRVQLVKVDPTATDEIDYGREWSLLVDYCAGASREWVEMLCAVLQKILLTLPETLDNDDYRAMFPTYRVRPMYRDLECFLKLLKLAGMERQPDFSDIEQITFDMERHLALNERLGQPLQMAQK